MLHDTDLAGRRRPIRSFVRRAGRLTSSQQRALDELWPDYGVDYAPHLLDLDSIFNRAAPRVFEIGFGNGESLVQLAIDDPTTDFLGVEVHDPGIGHCLIAARDAGLTNLRLISHDAIDVLEVQIPGDSLSRINLYFPDPCQRNVTTNDASFSPGFWTYVLAALSQTVPCILQRIGRTMQSILMKFLGNILASNARNDVNTTGICR